MSANQRIEQFRGQINLLEIRRDVIKLRQELESEKTAIAQARRRLPRGWCHHSPTMDLEISLNVQPADHSVRLPSIWPRSPMVQAKLSLAHHHW